MIKDNFRKFIFPILALYQYPSLKPTKDRLNSTFLVVILATMGRLFCYIDSYWTRKEFNLSQSILGLYAILLAFCIVSHLIILNQVRYEKYFGIKKLNYKFIFNLNAVCFWFYVACFSWLAWSAGCTNRQFHKLTSIIVIMGLFLTSLAVTIFSNFVMSSNKIALSNK